MQEEASDTDTDKFVILTHYIYIIYASSGSCFRRENKILVYISDFDEETWLQRLQGSPERTVSSKLKAVKQSLFASVIRQLISRFCQ